MKRALLLLPILLLSGCSGQNYASKLNLPAIEAPALLAPVTSASVGEDEHLITSIQNAQTPSQAETVLGQLRLGDSLAGLLLGDDDSNDTPEQKQTRVKWQAEYNRFKAYLEQAAQIKKAQLEDGDAKDSTGEVEQRLGYARQSSANLEELNKGIPKSTNADSDAPATPSTTLAPDTTSNSTPSTEAQQLTVAEQAWVDNLESAQNLIPKPNPNTSLAEDAVSLKNGYTASKAQYDQVPVPLRFATAAQFFAEEYSKALQAADLLEKGAAVNEREPMKQAVQLMDEAQSLSDQGFDEVKRLTGEMK